MDSKLQHLPAATVRLDELRDFFGRGGSKAGQSVSGSIYVAAQENSYAAWTQSFACFHPREDGGRWLAAVYNRKKNEKYVIRVLKTLAKTLFYTKFNAQKIIKINFLTTWNSVFPFSHMFSCSYRFLMQEFMTV